MLRIDPSPMRSIDPSLMRRIVPVLCAIVVASTWLGAQQRPVFRTGADAVLVDVFVRSKHEPVTGLTTASFELRDNDVLQKITSVGYERAPISVTLVVETSPDAAVMSQLDAGVAEIVRALQPDDRCALITFERRAQLVTGSLTSPVILSRPTDVGPAPEELETPAAVLDAVTMALATPPSVGRRSLVLIVTSGWDSASFTNWATARELGWRTGAIVSTVLVRKIQATPAFPGGRGGAARGVPMPQPPGSSVSNFLSGLASVTGGGVHVGNVRPRPSLPVSPAGGRSGRGAALQGVASRTDELIAAAMHNALDEARDSYVLSFTPFNVDLRGWHNIIVRVKDGKDFEVRARQGYFGG